MLPVKSYLVLILLWCFLHAENAVKADPDFICSGLDYYGTTAVKIGDYLQLEFLEIGGIVEVRDEKYFNRKFFPNHNWRGFFYLAGNIPIQEVTGRKVFITLGVEHESAHPTMGIKKSPTNYCEALYDDVYRNINLNSLLVRYNRVHLIGKNGFSGRLDYQLYLLANNTPELPGNTSSAGNGLSLGLEYRRTLSEPVSVYCSLFDRFIFNGHKKKKDWIYFNEGDTVVLRETTYSIIKEVNTLSAKTGLLLHWNKIKRNIDIHVGVLYGNIFGFVDSRDKRLQFSGGIRIYRQDLYAP